MIEYDVVNVPIVDIVNQIILFASKNRASDIHMDPRDDCLLIRMRIDGELRDHAKIPKAYERNLITRVKLISNMNITETRLPQDGAIKGRIEGKDMDMRVSVLPTNEGEKVVIRVLDYSKSLSGLESLGFSPKNFELLQKMLSVPNGIILVTGATGSGKSTTTYSMLQALNKEERNIITVEDPIEMNIEGVNQVQVNSEIGLTFATVLRSILRQDPNVILIGEIRDSETAQIAVRASITGHLVLSTLHTNNSLSTIERLLDMDVERYLLSSALTGIISQKLARRLCDKCKVQRPTTDYEKEIFKLVLNKDVDTVYDAKGCPECAQGYHGRIAIEEVLYISDELKVTLANPKTTKDELKKMVYTDDVTTLLGDGLEKIINGDTSFEEIFKLIEVDLEIQTIREESIERTERRERNKSNKGNLLGNLIIEAPEPEPTPEETNNEPTNTEEDDNEEYGGTANVVIPSTANIIIQAPPNANLGPQLSIPTGDEAKPAEANAPESNKDQTAIDIPTGDSAVQATTVSNQEPVQATTNEVTPNPGTEAEQPAQTQETTPTSAPAQETVPTQETVTTPTTTETPGVIDIPASTAVPEATPTPAPVQETIQTQEPVATPATEEVTPGVIDIPASTVVPEATTTPETETANAPTEEATQTTEPEVISIPSAETTTTEEIIDTTGKNNDVAPSTNEEQQPDNVLFQNADTQEPVEEQPTEENPKINRLFGTPIIETDENTTENTTDDNQNAEENAEEIIDTTSVESPVNNINPNINMDINLNETPEQPVQEDNNSRERPRNTEAFDYLFKYLENEVVNAKDYDFDDSDDDDTDSPTLNKFVPDTIKNDPVDSYFRNYNE